MTSRIEAASMAVFVALIVRPGLTHAATVSLYERVEESMTNGTAFANPFTGTQLRLNVTAPVGRALGSSFTWYGFHDGNGAGGQAGNVWKFRLCLDYPGEWVVNAGFYVPDTSTPNGPSQQFSYSVSSSNYTGEHGHLRVDAQNPRRLRHDDGTPWVPFPMHSSGLLGRDQTIARRWIDEHALLGVDALAVRFHSEANGTDPERYHFLLTNGNSGTSWPANGAAGFDYTRPDIGTWRYNEQLIEYAKSRGVKLSIWFGISGLNPQYRSYGPTDFPDDTTLGPNQKLFIRYFLARWAPYTNWWHWTVDSEYEEGGGGSLNRIRTFAAELQARNPWKTIITTHVLSDWSAGTSPELDLATIQQRVADTDVGATDCRSFITANDDHGRPVYNAEGVWVLANVTRSRIATWTHLMAGGFSHIAHFESPGGDPLSSSWATTWDHLNIRHKQDAVQIGRLVRFFNQTPGIDISRCTPRDDLVSISGGHIAMCLAEAGQSYYVWLDRGGSCSLDLRGGSGVFEVTRYRGVDLTQPTALSAISGGAVRSLDPTPTTGFGEDYLYIVGRRAGPPPSPGDFDADGDMDQADFGVLQTCFSGTGVLCSPGCAEADLDHDGAVDSKDLAVFMTCMEGPGNPPGG